MSNLLNGNLNGKITDLWQNINSDKKSEKPDVTEELQSEQDNLPNKDHLEQEKAGKASSNIDLSLTPSDYLNIKILDKDGIATDSRDDTELTVNGNLNFVKSFDLEKIAAENSGSLFKIDPKNIKINSSDDGKSVSLSYDSFLGSVNILSFNIVQGNASSQLEIESALISKEMLADTLNISPDLIREENGKMIISFVDLLNKGFSEKLEIAAKKININNVDLQGLSFNNISMANGKFAVSLDLKDVKLNAGTGKADTVADKSSENIAEINIKTRTLNLDKDISDSLQNGNIRLSNFANLISDTLEKNSPLNNVKVSIDNDKMTISGQALIGLVKSEVPLIFDGTELKIDFANATGSDFINEYITENFSRDLYNSTRDSVGGLSSKIEGTNLSLDFNEAVPRDLNMKIDNISLNNDGTLELSFSKGKIYPDKSENKITMINALFDGYTSGEDEATIRKLLSDANPLELSKILDKISLKRLEDELDADDLGIVMLHLARTSSFANNAAHLNNLIKIADDDAARELMKRLSDTELSLIPAESKISLIKELLDGRTSGEEEAFVKKIILHSGPADMDAIFTKVSPSRLESELDDGDFADLMVKLSDNFQNNNKQHLLKCMQEADDDITMAFLRKIPDSKLKSLAQDPLGKQILQKAWSNLDSGWTNGNEEKQMDRIKRFIP